MQQLALHTYKAATGADAERIAALERAWSIIEQLAPSTSVDPETLGIAGAIRRRLYQATSEAAHLDAAVELYGRGFELKRDYYNGENYGRCLDMRAELQPDPAEADYDRRTAVKVRQRVVMLLEAALSDRRSDERSDYRWMLASMANTKFALGQDAAEWEQEFRRSTAVEWELATFEDGKRAALAIAARARAAASTHLD